MLLTCDQLASACLICIYHMLVIAGAWIILKLFLSFRGYQVFRPKEVGGYSHSNCNPFESLGDVLQAPCLMISFTAFELSS